MKLYLSSYRIPDIAALEGLLGKPLTKATVAVIPNAKDYYAPRARRVKARLVADYLQTRGATPTVVDLNDYTDASKLITELTKYDMLWVMGGNPFCLREAMQKSGFDQAVRQILDGGVVYAGESAGACVAGTDLHGIELADDPEYAETVIWEGLTLVSQYILPHVDNEGYAPIMRPVIEGRGADKNTIVLNDNQAWVVDGDSARKVTNTQYGPIPEE